ncbi:MAG: hypothetical protein M0C28_37280 [Candidatus Moduliflexus flocculans]|nr:hypothetical protein [Candidatus Moduliflexus flocculans]
MAEAAIQRLVGAAPAGGHGGRHAGHGRRRRRRGTVRGLPARAARLRRSRWPIRTTSRAASCGTASTRRGCRARCSTPRSRASSRSA